MSDRYICHVTATTGHVRRSYRSEIAEDVIAKVAGWLDTDDFEILGGYRCVVIYRTRDCMEAQVLSADGFAFVTIGIALDDRRCGASLWRKMAGDGSEQPDQPWCAVRLEPALALDPEAAHWLGDFERCLAWGFDARKNRTN